MAVTTGAYVTRLTASGDSTELSGWITSVYAAGAGSAGTFTLTDASGQVLAFGNTAVNVDTAVDTGKLGATGAITLTKTGGTGDVFLYWTVDY